MGKLYSSILDTIGNTPVVKINNLAPDNVNLYVKIESFNPMASVKDRHAAVYSSPGRLSSRLPAATPASAWRWCVRKRVTRW